MMKPLNPHTKAISKTETDQSLLESCVIIFVAALLAVVLMTGLTLWGIDVQNLLNRISSFIVG